LGTSLTGKKIFLSDVTGKELTLIDFWASWCGPCRRMIPHLKKLNQKYHSKDFQIVSISFDMNSNSWKKAIEEEGIESWNNLIAGQNYSLNDTSTVALKYAVWEFPTLILMDKKGNIIARYDSKHRPEADLDKKLREVLRGKVKTNLKKKVGPPGLEPGTTCPDNYRENQEPNPLSKTIKRFC
jgi:thiol-disulfide isomerase/thioredoxin